MPIRKILFMSGLVVFTACLSLGYGTAGLYGGIPAAGAAALLWILARFMPDRRWLPPLGLFISVTLAAVGVLLKGSALWLILAAVMALVNWDLLLMNQSEPDVISRAFERKHYKWLAIAVGSGLLLAIIGQFIRLQLPFILIFGAIILVMYCFERIWFYFKNRKSNPG